MFPRLPTRATFVADTNFVSGTQKMFLILFRNILCRQQMFPSLRSPRNIMDNNVSATMCPRLPGPLWSHLITSTLLFIHFYCTRKICIVILISIVFCLLCYYQINWFITLRTCVCLLRTMLARLFCRCQTAKFSTLEIGRRAKSQPPHRHH